MEAGFRLFSMLLEATFLLVRHVFASTSCACDIRINDKKDSA